MNNNDASATALWVARQRAAHQLLDEPQVFADPVAVPILGPDEAAAIREQAVDYRSPFNLGFRSAVVARSRYSDDRVSAALDRGVRQIVLLGAGLDTFAYRRDVPAGTVIVEVDHPATQAWKRQQLDDAGIAIPAAVRFLPVDLARCSLAEALAGSGLDPTRPICVSWLGVTYYLSADVVIATLEQIASFAPGSSIVFDYFEPPATLHAEEPPGFATLRDEVAGAGEPWTCHFEPADIAIRAKAAGFDSFDDLDSATLSARYFADRNDGLAVSGPLHCAYAVRADRP